MRTYAGTKTNFEFSTASEEPNGNRRRARAVDMSVFGWMEGGRITYFTYTKFRGFVRARKSAVICIMIIITATQRPENGIFPSAVPETYPYARKYIGRCKRGETKTKRRERFDRPIFFAAPSARRSTYLYAREKTDGDGVVLTQIRAQSLAAYARARYILFGCCTR